VVHWNHAEGEERIQRLRAAGFEAELLCSPDSAPKELRALRENPPAAVLVDLSRLPSHGRALATALRQQKATRAVPIVFVGGETGKIAQTRELLPDAVYTSWTEIQTALPCAMKDPPANPVVPGTMAGYSGTPLVKKLGIKPQSVVAMLGAPEAFEKKLGPLPEGACLQRHGRSLANLVLLFAKSRADLERRLPSAARAVAGGGGLWIAWRKKAGGIPTGLTQNDVRTLGLSAGWVDYKICAFDETWSGLLFARRRADH
jgi:CheY-like chemotaxis protein